MIITYLFEKVKIEKNQQTTTKAYTITKHKTKQVSAKKPTCDMQFQWCFSGGLFVSEIICWPCIIITKKILIVIYRGFYMSAHVLLTLLNEFGEK